MKTYIINIRPREDRRLLMDLQLRKNGSPYWKAEEKLPVKKSSKKRKPRTERRSTKRRSSNKRRTKRRSSRLRGGE